MILPTLTAIYLALGAVAAAPTDNAALARGAGSLLHYSFETQDDRDFDNQPDHWTRRTGAGFPAYVETEIDRKEGRHLPGEPTGQSLRFRVNGGPAIMYSPPVPVDAMHSYTFEGYIRTQSLESDAVLVSISFLNHKRQRIQRFLTVPVTGTHDDWVRVSIPDMAPHRDASFVVVGCHLVQGRKMDIHGAAWFDDLWIGKLPQMTLASNFQKHFVERQAEIQITTNVSGLDSDGQYKLHLELRDSSDVLVDEVVRDLSAAPAAQAPQDPQHPAEPAHESVPASTSASQSRPPEVWKLTSKDYGFYHVRSSLEHDGKIIMTKETSFAVMDLVGGELPRGEYGWTLSAQADQISPEYLTDLARESGINWIKYPLWQSVHSKDSEWPARIINLFDNMQQSHITPVGLLGDPPPELRNQFATDWSGISEIFSMSPKFWSRSLEPVIARYSSTVRYWQLGSDADSSFVGMKALPQTLESVKKEFDRIGRDTRIGLRWQWATTPPPYAQIPQTFLSYPCEEGQEGAEFIEKLRAARKAGFPCWVLIDPLSAKRPPEERGVDLVKRMVWSKIGGADAIFASNVFDKDHGLLNSDGSPTLLYLPWRTVALALQGAEYLGPLNLPHKSINHAFARGDEVVVIIWNDKPVTEEIYLGEDVTIADVFGRQRKAETINTPDGKRNVIHAGPMPLVIRGCSEAIARWGLAVALEKGSLASQHGGQSEAVLVHNTFQYGVSGRVRIRIPGEWDAEPKEWPIQLAAGEKTRLPTMISLPPNVSLGTVPVDIDFEIVGDRSYRFQVHREVKVGLNDVLIHVVERILPDGRLEIEQLVTNNTEPLEILDFRCSVIVRGHKRQNQRVTKLGKGQDKKLYYLPGGASLRGEPVWLRIEQVDGRRNLNYRWKVGQNEAQEK